MRTTITYDCAKHKRRVDLGGGTAATISARAFAAGMEPCPTCDPEGYALVECPACHSRDTYPHYDELVASRQCRTCGHVYSVER